MGSSNIADKQEKFIADARRLLGPDEVIIGKVPRWLNQRLARYRKEHDLDRLPVSMLLTSTASIICRGGHWLDHWGTGSGFRGCCSSKADNLVSEPYSFGSESAGAVERFCEALGLEWHVSSNTWWFPGSTIRIIIHPRQK